MSISEEIKVKGPWWSVTSDQKYAFGLAVVTFSPEKELTVYAYSEITDKTPFTLEVAEELQGRFESHLGKTLVRGT